MATKRSRSDSSVPKAVSTTSEAEPVVRKRARRPAEAAAAASASDDVDHDAAADSGASGKKGKRFLLFVGNIPFTAPYDAVLEHFSCVGRDNITELRLLTRRKSGDATMVDGRPLHKGCGFIEFANDAALKKALKLHHSVIKGYGDDPAGKLRKINVELTAGGGGSGENRKQRIAKKNSALTEERRKHHEEVQAAPPPVAAPAPAPAPASAPVARAPAKKSYGAPAGPPRAPRSEKRSHAEEESGDVARAVPTRAPKGQWAKTDAERAAPAPAASSGFRGGLAFAKQLAASMA